MLPLGKILKVPGKVATKIGKSSDEAAALLNTGKKAGDDFIVTVAEGSKYAQRFIEAEARLAAKQAQKAAAIEKAKGMDGVLYSKFFPTIEPELTIASLKYFIAEVKAGASSVSSWLAKLKADKALDNLLAKTSDEELEALYASVQQVAQAPKSLEALEQAVAKGGKTGVEDFADRCHKVHLKP